MSEKQVQTGVSRASGLEISISVSDPKLEPKFRPIIEKISNVIREVTGTVCSEEQVAKLRV